MDAFGRRAIQAFETADSSALAGILDPSLTTSTAWGQIAALRDTLTAFRGDSLDLIGWNIFSSPDTYRADLTYQSRGLGWALVTVALARRQGSLVTTGFHFERTTAALADLNAFTLTGRSWRHYLVLGAAATCAIATLMTAMIVVRTPMPRRWGWALAALVGIGTVGINWTTGAMFVNPLFLQLFSAGIVRPGLVGPWTVSFALPVGAALALYRRHQFLTAARTSASPPAAA